MEIYMYIWPALHLLQKRKMDRFIICGKRQCDNYEVFFFLVNNYEVVSIYICREQCLHLSCVYYPVFFLLIKIMPHGSIIGTKLQALHQQHCCIEGYEKKQNILKFELQFLCKNSVIFLLNKHIQQYLLSNFVLMKIYYLFK